MCFQNGVRYELLFKHVFLKAVRSVLMRLAFSPATMVLADNVFTW